MIMITRTNTASSHGCKLRSLLAITLVAVSLSACSGWSASDYAMFPVKMTAGLVNGLGSAYGNYGGGTTTAYSSYVSASTIGNNYGSAGGSCSECGYEGNTHYDATPFTGGFSNPDRSSYDSYSGPHPDALAVK